MLPAAYCMLPADNRLLANKMIVTRDKCKELSDKEIVVRSLVDVNFFACLYQRYEPVLLRYIRQLSLVGEDEARDILQESFIKIWRHLNEFDNSMKLSSWLYRIVHNETVSFIRKDRSYGKDRKTDINDLNADLPDETEVELDPEERYRTTYEILNRLPIKYRESLVLKFIEKKSYEEISDILRIPEGTVATRINRAKSMFREMAGNKRI